MRWYRWYRQQDVFLQALMGVTSTIMLGLVIVAFALVTGIGPTLGLDDIAPADWDVNVACQGHQGIRQVIGSDYPVAVVCLDGRYISNPHD